jgi:hypothetical protein
MSTLEFITALFYHLDEHMRAVPKHPDAYLWPSEVVTLGLLHALKGVGNRAFYRWLTRDYRALFPRLPERTRLFRLFKTHGIELIHPMREGKFSRSFATARTMRWTWPPNVAR